MILHVPEGCVEAYKAVEPWSKFKEIVSMELTKFKLTYKVDGEVYKTYELLEGEKITPEEEPKKEGYEFSGWSEIPPTMPAENLTITGSFTLISDYDEIQLISTGKGTWCSKYDLDFTNVEGLKAYIATGYSDVTNTVWLTRVFVVPAGEGLVLKGDPNGQYHVPHTTSKECYANFLVGNYGEAYTIGPTTDDYKNFVMKGGQFVGIEAGGTATVSKNRAYLQIPLRVFTGTRSVNIGYEDDGTTEIYSIDNGKLIIENDVYYNLNGQRVDNPTKGIYIKNGHKVVIRSATK